MYLAALQDKLVQQLQTNPTLVHAQIVETLEHQERIALLDTIREMERRGLLKRDLTERDANGKMVLRYLRVG